MRLPKVGPVHMLYLILWSRPASMVRGTCEEVCELPPCRGRQVCVITGRQVSEQRLAIYLQALRK